LERRATHLSHNYGARIAQAAVHFSYKHANKVISFMGNCNYLLTPATLPILFKTWSAITEVSNLLRWFRCRCLD